MRSIFLRFCRGKSVGVHSHVLLAQNVSQKRRETQLGTWGFGIVRNGHMAA